MNANLKLDFMKKQTFKYKLMTQELNVLVLIQINSCLYIYDFGLIFILKNSSFTTSSYRIVIEY